MATLTETMGDVWKYRPRIRNIFSPKKESISPAALDYMAKVNSAYSGEDNQPDDLYDKHNHMIAMDLVNRLISEGKTPRIAVVRGLMINKNRETIIPSLSNGEKQWDEYHVCCEGNLAYDPMIGVKPVDVREYPEIAFLGDVDMSILIPEKEIRRYAGREPISNSF